MRVPVGFRNCLHQNKWELPLLYFNRDCFDDKKKEVKLLLRESMWLIQVHAPGLQRVSHFNAVADAAHGVPCVACVRSGASRCV